MTVAVKAQAVDGAPISMPASMSARHSPLAAEVDFYNGYDWCLNPYLTVAQTIERLRTELDRLTGAPPGWQASEIATNVYLLSSGLLNCIEDYLRGPSLRVPKRIAAMRASRALKRTVESLLALKSRRSRAEVSHWRNAWLCDFDEFLSALIAEEPRGFLSPSTKLAARLRVPLPSDLQAKRIGLPTPFRRLDLTHIDVLALGRRFIARYSDRSQPILIMGLRTAGTYFAPLLKSFLRQQGYCTVAFLTVEPNKGPGPAERHELKSFAGRGYRIVVVDDPPHSGSAILSAINIARRAGFPTDRLTVLVPAHAATSDWVKRFPAELIVLLEPEHWYKRTLLDPKAVEPLVFEYFRARNFVGVKIVASDRAEKFNASLKRASSDARGTRLKRIFEVQLETIEGMRETRFVLAKSVGWGWLGYHAFLAGLRLAAFVPPLLGLRNGILYMEWIPPADDDHAPARSTWIDRAASYVAARARSLGLASHSAAGMNLRRQNNGHLLLEKGLSGAYGRHVIGMLARSRVGRSLSKQSCPVPTFIDGNMRRVEWIAAPGGPLKTDYEHHGMCKNAVNVVDPAYDVAETILDFELSPAEEQRFIRKYIEESRDVTIGARLFMNKLLAGFWAMNQAQEQLFGAPAGSAAQQECHWRFMNAWNFLTVQTARTCGDLYLPPTSPRWRAPLVFTDIDGVLDMRAWGFPATSAAGIEALRLFATHGHSVAVNTARSVAEVKEYCRAYRLVGGVAEHGAYIWDAVAQEGRVLISQDTVKQLEKLRKKLREIPGVFLDERHEYSIRAFTYQAKPRGIIASLAKSVHSSEIGDGALAPLSPLVIGNLMASSDFDRLSHHHTSIDTTFVAKEVDKGSGLVALRDWVLGAGTETIAIGDQESDLSMFRVATRSFAPANISCARQAALFSCNVVSAPYQRGLLEIARKIIHSDGSRCPQCASGKQDAPSNLFTDLLSVADRSSIRNLFDILFDPAAFRIFLR